MRSRSASVASRMISCGAAAQLRLLLVRVGGVDGAMMPSSTAGSAQLSTVPGSCPSSDISTMYAQIDAEDHSRGMRVGIR